MAYPPTSDDSGSEGHRPPTDDCGSERPTPPSDDSGSERPTPPTPGHGRETTIPASFLDHASIERSILEFGTRQHLVLSLAQLVEIGLAPSSVRSRLARSRLHRIHHSVYSLVPEELLTKEGRWMAAVLACGPGAVLSHRNAAYLLGLRATSRTKIDVAVPHRSARSHERIDIHRSVTLAAADLTIRNEIPCTSVARTLFDLAAVVPRRSVERAFDQAEIEEILDLTAVMDQLSRNPNHRGAPTVKSILDEHYIGRTPTWNEFEEAFFAICRRARAPLPEVNQWVDLHDGGPAIRADFLWREQRVIVETDGRKVHGTHQARQRDPRRDQRALLAGWCPIRTTWRQVMHRPSELEEMIVRLVTATAPQAWRPRAA